MESAPLPLLPALRLIHCMQKERGASCALVGSMTHPNATDYPYESNLRSQRVASNSAISAFYGSAIWHSYCGEQHEEGEELEIATLLLSVRQLVEGDVEKDYFFFHDVYVEYSSIISRLVDAFVINELSKKKNDLSRKKEEDDVSGRNANVVLSLVDLVLSFVTLKESLGMERAMLSGLMAEGIHDDEMHNDKNQEKEVDIDVQVPSHGARLGLVVNDLVIVVENQHRIMRDLQKQTECSAVSETLLQLIDESIVPSDAMKTLQDHVRKDFDIEAFQQAMSPTAFWSGITCYMDRLHSMELFLIEELENCEGSFEDLDLHSLAGGEHPPSSSSSIPTLSDDAVNKMTQNELKDALISLLAAQKESKQLPPPSPIKRQKSLSQNSFSSKFSLTKRSKDDRPALEEWEISLYDVEFHKRIGRGSAGTTYLGSYMAQDVAVKGKHLQ